MKTLIIIALLTLTACNESGGGGGSTATKAPSAELPSDPGTAAPSPEPVVAPQPAPAPAPSDCSALPVLGTWTAITSTVTLQQDATDVITINADCTAHSTYCDMDFAFTPPGSADWLDDHEVAVHATTGNDGRSECNMPNGIQPYLGWYPQSGYTGITFFRHIGNYVHQ